MPPVFQSSPYEAKVAPARARLSLSVLLLPALLVAMDISILFVAGPTIARDLAPSASQWLWMMDVYSFVMAGLLITMGNLGDRIGRRRLLLLGAAAFGIASAGIAFAPSADVFIAARALLGVGAATLAPSTLALIRAIFADADQRRGAIAAWTAAFSSGAVAGPVVGGLLLEHFWWGSVFLINVPVMVLLLIAAPFLIPESRDLDSRGFDPVGAALSLGGIIGIVFAGKRFAEHGADSLAVISLVGGMLLATVAVLWMRRAAHPLLDLSLFRHSAFSAALGTNSMAGFVMTGIGLLTFTFLQTVHEMSPLLAAFTALPTLLGTIIGAVTASRLARRIRPAILVVAGFLVAAAGFGLIATVTPGSHVGSFIGGYTVLTLGVGALGTMANSLILDTAPLGRASAAAGTSETGMVLGEAVGIAVFGTISAAVYRRIMTEDDTFVDLPPEVIDTVAGAFGHAQRLPAAEAAALTDIAGAAFGQGVSMVALIAGILLTGCALLAGVLLRHVPAGTTTSQPDR